MKRAKIEPEERLVVPDHLMEKKCVNPKSWSLGTNRMVNFEARISKIPVAGIWSLSELVEVAKQ